MSQDQPQENHSATPPDRIESWGEIANYLGSTMTTVRRWEKELGLPVRRQKNLKRGSVIAYKHELDAWRQSRITALSEPPKPQPQPEQPRPKRFLLRWLPAAVAMAAALALAAVLGWTGRDPLNVDVDELILTAYPGGEGYMSFAPDGQRFAYAGGDENGAGVFIKQIGVEPARLVYTEPTKSICCTAWSPDGSMIAISYSLPHRDNWRIGLVDPSGKWMRDLGTGGPGLSWRNDSRAVLYSKAESPGGPSAVFEHHLETGQKRQLSFPPAGSWGDILGVPSPDGSQLAISRYPSFGKGDVFIGQYGGKEARRWTYLENWVVGLTWFPAGDHVVFGGNVGPTVGLFLVNRANPREPRLIPGTRGIHRAPTSVRLSDGTIRIGYQREIWNMDLTLFDPVTGKTRAVAVSNRGEETPDVSNTGDLVFLSQRSGASNLWVCDNACLQPKQITNLPETSIQMTPKWSPDGRRIAFITRLDGVQSLRIFGADGQDAMTLVSGFDVGDPSWSADGRFLYFRSNRSGKQEIWKASADGQGEARQITRGGGSEAFESANGRWLYLTHGPENSPLMRMPATGEGTESPITEVGSVRRGFWRAAGGAIYFWKDAGRNLSRFDTLTGRISNILSTAKNRPAQTFSVNASGLVVWAHNAPYYDDLYAVDLRPRPFWRIR